VKTGALVLAAGASRRFGSDKRRHLIDGQPLLKRTVQTVVEAGLPCRVCLRPGDGDIPLLIDLPGIEFLECTTAGHGMGATLAEGVGNCRDWDALLVVLGDMGWVQPATLVAVASKLTAHTIVQPTFRQQPGQPVGFGRDFFAELRDLSGDKGGRAILLRHRSAWIGVPVEDQGILRDLDFPAR
jgi:molybdenum cofactor cytidylyltransferase